MKKIFYLVYTVAVSNIFVGCYSNSLVQSANTLNPKQSAITASFETSRKDPETNVYDLPNFGVRYGIADGVELQTKSNLSSYVELGSKFRLLDETKPYQMAVGFNVGLVRVPNLFHENESDNTEILITEKVLTVPIYLSKKINNFTIFGGSKIGYAVESKEALVTANLGLAYLLPKTKHHLFIEVYNVQSPKSLNTSYNNLNRYGMSIGVSLNAF